MRLEPGHVSAHGQLHSPHPPLIYGPARGDHVGEMAGRGMGAVALADPNDPHRLVAESQVRIRANHDDAAIRVTPEVVPDM